MLICVAYDNYSTAAVTKINSLKTDPRFCAGSFSFSGSLDYLASTSGFVCYRCKEDFAVESRGGGDLCWIFEAKFGAAEFADIMSTLVEAKFHSILIAATTRGLIERSRVMCNGCRRMERPLPAENDIDGPSRFPDTMEQKPTIFFNAPIQHCQQQEYSITEISSEVENSPIRAPSHVAAHQDVSILVIEPQETKPPVTQSGQNNTALENGHPATPVDPTPSVAAHQEVSMVVIEDEEETKPLVMQTVQNNTLENSHPASPVDPTTVPCRISLTDPRANRVTVAVKQQHFESSGRQSSPPQGTTVATCNVFGNPMRQFDLGVVKQEYCEALLASKAANVVKPAFPLQGAVEATGNISVNAVQQFDMGVVKQECGLAALASKPANHMNTNAQHSYPSNIMHEEELRLRANSSAQLEGEVVHDWWSDVVNAQDLPGTSHAAVQMHRGEFDYAPRESNGEEQIDLSSYNHGASYTVSQMRDLKTGLATQIRLNREQPSHFDQLMGFPANPSVFRNSFPKSRCSSSNELNMGSHSHLLDPAYVTVEVVEGYLPIWKVNRNSTQFQRIRLADLNPNTNLRFHSSILKRKTEQWVKVKIEEAKQVAGATFLIYRHEIYRKPDQMSKPMRLKLCCDSLLHFILIHTDDLMYRA